MGSWPLRGYIPAPSQLAFYGNVVSHCVCEKSTYAFISGVHGVMEI